jgi:epsilon-lactone hydrolase
MSRRPQVPVRIMRGVVRALVRPVLGPRMPVRAQRWWLAAATRLTPLADGVVVRAGELGGRPTEVLVPRDGEPERTVLYLHGGGFTIGSPATHRALAAHLAAAGAATVHLLDYRLAPEHPFPAALDDALDAYHWLLAQGIPATRIVVAGDSAGGHLAATLAAELCRMGRPAPAGIVLFSPWADLTCELSLEWDRECRDPYIVPALGRRFGMLYAGEHDFEDPRLALLRCTTTGLPPFLIQAGGADALRADAEHLAEVLTEIGVSCELQIWRGQMHVFQVLHMLLPEARAAMRETARFVRSVIGAEPASAAA